ncbi:hypothetical protein FHG87_023826 [Trinorchestia longiramus]|nr:hypothetical protein FHG87_023826 [Trinorchestia longiramus]
MKRHELTEHHERMRAERSRHIINEIPQGTLPNLMFTYEKNFCIQQVVNHQNDRVWSSSSLVEGRIVTRRQNAQSVMIWAVVIVTGRFPLIFVPYGDKLNSEWYIYLILESKFLPWVTKHFQGSLQRNPNLDSEEHSIFHKQRSMANKEPRPQSFELFCLVHFEDKSFSHPSHFSRVP